MKAARFMIFGREDSNGAWEAYGKSLEKKLEKKLQEDLDEDGSCFFGRLEKYRERSF
jgi:hypothetical protein